MRLQEKVMKTINVNIVSTFRREIGLQFLINRLSLSFFSNNLITACLCEILREPLVLDSLKEFLKVFLILVQKHS